MRFTAAPLFSTLLLATAVAAGAQPISVTVEQVPCLPIAGNGVAWAQVANNQPETEVRLYLRRFHEVVEDAYYVTMQPAGGGRFWGTFPKPEDQPLERTELIEQREALATDDAWAAWWRAKELSQDRDPTGGLDDALIRERASEGKSITRHWLLEMNDQDFQRWLEQQTNEPAEYFVSVHDAQGQRLSRSETRVTPVKSDCATSLTAEQAGYAENLIVGETAGWQREEQPFHWLCDGIVSRRDQTGIRRVDEVCRTCVIAWWRRPVALVPLGVGVGVVTGILIDEDDPPPASPITP